MHSGLVAKLAQEIHANAGFLALDQYITHCLCDPEFGYYQHAPVFGPQGDFITAPELTPLFGQTLAVWVARQWGALGSPAPWLLLEAGPGTGQLLQDILHTLRKIAPAAATGVQVYGWDLSQQTRAQARVDVPITWVQTWACLPPGVPVVVVANEFLDALPVQQFCQQGEYWYEVGVALGVYPGEEIRRALRPLTSAALLPRPPAAGQTVLEYSPQQAHFLAGMKQHLHIGAALVIDYGYTHGGGDTFQAIRQHQRVDPFATPGAADLTAHVDFAWVAEQLGVSQCQVWDQSAFLLNHGLALRATQAMTAQPEHIPHIESVTQRLLDPRQMGSLFKVLQYRGI